MASKAGYRHLVETDFHLMPCSTQNEVQKVQMISTVPLDAIYMQFSSLILTLFSSPSSVHLHH